MQDEEVPTFSQGDSHSGAWKAKEKRRIQGTERISCQGTAFIPSKTMAGSVCLLKWKHKKNDRGF